MLDPTQSPKQDKRPGQDGPGGSPGSKGLYFQWFGFELLKNHAGRTC